MLPSISTTGPSSLQFDPPPKQSDPGSPASSNIPKTTANPNERNAQGRLRSLQLLRQQALNNMKTSINKALDIAMNSSDLDGNAKYGLGLHKDWNAVVDPGQSLENARNTLSYLEKLGVAGEVIKNAQTALAKYQSAMADQKQEEKRPISEDQTQKTTGHEERDAIAARYIKEREELQKKLNSSISYLDYGNPQVPVTTETTQDTQHKQHTDELFDAVSKALDAAEQSMITDAKLAAEIQEYRAKLNKNCGPQEAQAQALGAQRIVEQLGAFGTDIANPLQAAIAKHTSAVTNPDSGQSNDTPPPPPKDNERQPIDPRATMDGGARLQHALRTMLSGLQDIAPAAGPDSPKAELQKALDKSLDAMLNSPYLRPHLAPEEISEIEAHLQRLKNTGGAEPTPEQLSETLGFVRTMTQQFAGDLKETFEEALKDIPDEDQRKKIREELAPELAQLDAIARGVPLYQPPPLPPPPLNGKDQTPSKSPLNESGASSGADEKNDKQKRLDDMDKQTKMLKEVEEAEMAFFHLQLMMQFAKKARDFALSLI